MVFSSECGAARVHTIYNHYINLQSSCHSFVIIRGKVMANVACVLEMWWCVCQFGITKLRSSPSLFQTYKDCK